VTSAHRLGEVVATAALARRSWHTWIDIGRRHDLSHERPASRVRRVYASNDGASSVSSLAPKPADYVDRVDGMSVDSLLPEEDEDGAS
jgi:hypothetical protein